MRRCLLLLLVLLPLAVLAGTVTDEAWPRLTILPLAQAPVIDGTLAAGEWEEAVTVPGFTHLGQTALIANQPLMKLAWSPQALLVAAEIPLPPGQRAKATATDFDGTVWNDDSVEVHLDRGHQHKANYQFIANALGTHFDSLGGDAKWNGEWQVKAQNTPGKWSCEFAIPWSTVGGAPKTGDLDGFNVVINSSYLGGTLSFSPLRSSAHETVNYAHLVYGQSLALSVEGLDAASREITFRRLGAGPLEVKYTLSGPDGAALETQTLPVGPVTTLPINLPAEPGGGVKPGQYTVAVKATTEAGIVLSRQVSLAVEEALRVELAAFTQKQVLDLFLRPEATIFPDADTDYDLALSGPNGVVKQWQYRRPATARAETADLRLLGKDLPDGKLTFRIVATNRRTQVTRTVERVLAENPLRPVWLGTKEGLTDKVPAP